MILITGASGNVGREVLKQVAATGAQVRAAFQSVSKAQTVPSGVEVVTMDYRDPKTLTVLEDVERVFLVGPPTANLAALERNAVNAIKDSGVRHIVKLSAMGGRGAIFPRQHAESEDYIKSSGVAYTFLRPNGFMQNFVIYNAGTINSQNAFFGVQADGAVSHIDIRDIAAVAVKTLTENGHEGKAYTLTGREALSNVRCAEILSEEIGREIRYVDLSVDEFKQGLLSAGVPEWSTNALIDLQRFYAWGGASAVTRDVEQLLGRRPISFEQFSRDYVNAFRSEQRAAS